MQEYFEEHKLLLANLAKEAKERSEREANLAKEAKEKAEREEKCMKEIGVVCTPATLEIIANYLKTINKTKITELIEAQADHLR